MFPAQERRVAGEGMQDKPVRGSRNNFDGKRPIDATVTRARRHDIAPRRLAAEGACNRSRIERYFVELSITEPSGHGSERVRLLIALNTLHGVR
jgi:hypothetical protein